MKRPRSSKVAGGRRREGGGEVAGRVGAAYIGALPSGPADPRVVPLRSVLSCAIKVVIITIV